MSNDLDRFYFGCGTIEAGHYFWVPNRPYSKHDVEEAQPWGYTVDGRLQPQGKLRDVQGPTALHKRDGWTAIAWWDRSGPDKRGACCSVYAQRGDHDFASMVAAFKRSFPWAAERLTFELVLVEGGESP